jgi:hypothetical protein
MMGRLGIGTVILRGKVPDSLLAKIMMILIGSPKASEHLMPDPGAHKQLRAALKLGAPIWWKIFRQKFAVHPHNAPPKPKRRAVLGPSLVNQREMTPASQFTLAANVPKVETAMPAALIKPAERASMAELLRELLPEPLTSDDDAHDSEEPLALAPELIPEKPIAPPL